MVQAYKSFMWFQADRDALYESPAVLHFVYNLLILGALDTGVTNSGLQR